MENHPNPENPQEKWGTWEDLLLACAVKRHGFQDWAAVAMEIQSRTTLPNLLTTAHHCEQKFLDLRRRFAAQRNDDVQDTLAAGDNVDHVPWLDELRKLRVAELQQAVQRSDVSIMSLQLKVKRLEEERGKNLKENVGEEEDKPDLANSGEPEPQNDKKGGQEKAPEPASSEPATRLDEDHNSKQPTGDESDRENQSVNESNSTVSVGKTGEGEVKLEPNPVQAGSKEPDAVVRKANPFGEESNNGSYDAAAKVPTCDSLPPSEERKVEDSSELRDSVTHSRDGGGEGGTRESSEVQSSASLTRKRKPGRRKEEEEEPPENDEVTVKSQPLIGVLDLIKGQDHSILFERRLEGQESEKYKNIVRQHLDFETIQRRLRNGTYSRCTQAFFRDLLLLFTNATVFFHKDSAESRTAQQLGCLVSAEIKHHVPMTRPNPLPRNPDPLPPNPSSSSKPKPDSLLSKHTASAPILVCRKRSSFSAKPSSSSATFGQKGDLRGQEKKKPASDTKPPLKPSSSDTDDEPPKKKEKPVTGVRSLRRNNKSISGNSSKKAGTASKPPETPKSDKSKAEGSTATDKKRSAADFLKRIKRNAPAEVLRSGGSGGGNNSKGGVSGKDQKKTMSSGKGDKGKEKASRHGGGSSSSGDKKNENENSSQSKRSVGRPPKKVGETNNAVSAKRGREGGGKDKRPKKRSRK